MTRWAVSTVLFLLMACSGAPAPEPAPAPMAEPEEPAPTKAQDPLADRLDRFEKAYTELVCKANMNYDPMGNIVTLREPYGRMLELIEEKSKSLDAYEQVLQNFGFEKATDYVAEKEYLDKARPAFFRNLMDRLLDIVDNCPR